MTQETIQNFEIVILKDPEFTVGEVLNYITIRQLNLTLKKKIDRGLKVLIITTLQTH